MRWILWRWFLAGGMRSFLAGYAGCPLIIGLLATIVVAIAYRSEAGLLIVAGTLIACLAAPVGLLVGMEHGIKPGWGPWDGRLVYMGLMAGLVVLIIVGRRLEKRYPVPDGGHGTSRVPVARVVTAHLFPTVPWKQLIGPTLLVIAGAGLVLLGDFGLLSLGPAYFR